MKIVYAVLICCYAVLSLYNTAKNEPEAGRFTIIMCGIFTILYKLCGG